jgi:2,2-dialkylglycine decarboxylase (pyruvate)
MPARPCAHRQDVGDAALRRDARHRHLGQGPVRGSAICGTITTPDIAARTRGNCGLPWAGTYSSDPLPAAVALKQLDIVLCDELAIRAERLGAIAAAELAALANKHECVGDVRGKGLYRMLDIVKNRKTRSPDPIIAERIRDNCALEGVCAIAVKHYVRFAPPLIITEAAGEAIARAMQAASCCSR